MAELNEEVDAVPHPLKSAVAGLWWGSYRLRCGFCDRDMKNEHSLNVHVSRYHNAGSVPSAVPCPVCRKTYSNQYSLRTHMHIQAQLLSTDFFNIIKAKSPSLVSFLDAKVSLLSSVGKFLRFSTRTNCFFWERRNVVDVPGWPSLKHHLPLHQDQPQSLPNPCWLSRPHRPRGPCSPPSQRPLRPKTPSLISVHPKQTELGLAWSKLA